MKSKKVLFLIDTLNTGGAEKSLLDILPQFKTYIPIVCHVYKGEELKDKYMARGIQVYSLNIPPPYNFSKAIAGVTEVVRKCKPDIIHSSLFRSDIISRVVASRLKVPLINSLINNSYHPSRFRNAGFVMKLKLKGVQLIDALTAGKVDLFISNSEAIRHSNAKALGIPLEKIKVIYRGRNVQDFQNIPVSETELLKNELYIQHQTVILNVSRLLDRKGQIDLLHAFKIIRKDHTDTILLIAGDGPHRKLIEQAIADLELNEHVKLLGNRSDVPRLLSVADCFVFPSHYEGLPGALIEAMMAKVPIVASRIPENMECVDNTSATLHKPGDIQDLATAMSIALTSSEINNKVFNAYAQAMAKFDLQSIVEQYEKTYDDLLTCL
ncbi:MAG TPA: glycosyltransferase [Ohtaekwangia sp.]|uniref:glycosyltransferase n=1 Tax=Ohtaekwangia sp. TaxID=2066019 RepID=UPI002F92A74D